MTSSDAKVIPAETSDVTSADATDAGFAKISNAASAEAADVATTKTTDVTSAKAAHVAATKATTVSAATTTTAAGFCTGGNKAAGKQRTCQNHYQSSSHDILHWMGGRSATGSSSGVGASKQDRRRRRDKLEMGILACRLY
jgi:hypothetical protein